MGAYGGPIIERSNLVLYIDLLNNNTYNDTTFIYDLITESISFMGEKLNYIDNKLQYNSKHYMDITIPSYIDMKNFIIDLWFIKGDITFNKSEDGIYYSNEEKLLKICINGYLLDINIYFDDISQSSLNNYKGKIYNLILKFTDGDINYTVSENINTSLSDYINITDIGEKTSNEFIGKIISVKIYNTENIDINKNFKNIKNRKWV